MNDIASRIERLAHMIGAKEPCFPPKSLIEKTKVSIKRDLPAEYMAWILTCGECDLEQQLGLEFVTVSHPIDGPLRDVCSELPMILDLGIPIAKDSFENYFVLLDTRDKHPIVFAEGTSVYEASCVVASSLEKFLIMINESMKTKDQDWWLNKEFLLTHDPDITSFADIPMPWDDEE